ncbi:DUF6221 family protein [Actinoallomurus iriomotensis]|uniref:Uncharacterized protein n=1 Tax=Actinoallomurus iriomotensis TaxID=478107 RepID=A0A9W6RU74_9ACTN|nr:DUF6221 family protein [Actinoallomurus iriomotensis]GLY81855.1 hypothetical protein Airi01_101220 [Actinoallomurus iriomotensis]
MSDLAEFLRARLDEDERDAQETERLVESGMEVPGAVTYSPERVLREVEAKRQLVREISTLTEFDWGEPDGSMRSDYVEAFRRVLRIHALPYADHPDYREEWRP